MILLFFFSYSLCFRLRRLFPFIGLFQSLSLSFSRSQSQCCAFFVCIQTILMIKCSWDKNNNEITIELNFRIWKYPISLSSALINGWALGPMRKTTKTHTSSFSFGFFVHILLERFNNKDQTVQMEHDEREREREESKGRDREANGFNEKWLIYIYRFRFRVAQYHSALNWVLPAKEHHSTPQIIFHPDLFRRATYTFFIVFSISLTFNLFDDVYEGRKNIDVEIMKRTNEWTNEFPFLIYNFREKFHGKNW